MRKLYNLAITIEVMKITVNYQSGSRQIFIVPKTMLALDFRKLAEDIGGKIDNIEFSLSDNRTGLLGADIKESLLYPE